MSGTTAKWSIPYIEGTDIGNTIDETDQAKAELLDDLLTPYQSGALASRPVSTPGTPGIAGRTYRATDGANAGRVFKDYGTGWDEIAVDRNSDAKLGTVRGAVNTDGTVLHGAGFTAARTGAGLYTVTFATAFTGSPTVDLTPISANDATSCVSGYTDGSFQARLRVAGALADVAFGFIAVGPR